MDVDLVQVFLSGGLLKSNIEYLGERKYMSSAKNPSCMFKRVFQDAFLLVPMVLLTSTTARVTHGSSPVAVDMAPAMQILSGV